MHGNCLAVMIWENLSFITWNVEQEMVKKSKSKKFMDHGQNTFI